MILKILSFSKVFGKFSRANSKPATLRLFLLLPMQNRTRTHGRKLRWFELENERSQNVYGLAASLLGFKISQQPPELHLILLGFSRFRRPCLEGFQPSRQNAVACEGLVPKLRQRVALQRCQTIQAHLQSRGFGGDMLRLRHIIRTCTEKLSFPGLLIRSALRPSERFRHNG